METYYKNTIMNLAIILETFLGGMETCIAIQSAFCYLPLKPSLVEWKLKDIYIIIFFVICLETFLGGMETKRHIYYYLFCYLP